MNTKTSGRERRRVRKIIIHLQGTTMEVICRHWNIAIGPGGGEHHIQFFDKKRGEFELPNTVATLRHDCVTAIELAPDYVHPFDKDWVEAGGDRPAEKDPLEGCNEDYRGALLDAFDAFQDTIAEASFRKVVDDTDYQGLMAFIEWVDNPGNKNRERDLGVLHRLKKFW